MQKVEPPRPWPPPPLPLSSIKANTSNSYLEEQRRLHGHKQWLLPTFGIHPPVILTGARFHYSIGYAIYKQLGADGFNVIQNHRNLLTGPNLDDWDLKANALVMCHGATCINWFEDSYLSLLENVIDVNLKATVRVTQAFVKQTIDMECRKKIVAIGSMAYNHPLNGSAVYCASKAGLAMLMRCLAWELAPKGYDVYTIHPSNVADTPMTEQTILALTKYRGLTPAEAKAYWNDSPIRDHILTKNEIAGVVSYLLGPGTEYLSGTQFELAGGQR